MEPEKRPGEPVKIYTRVVIDMKTGKTLEEESFEYDGPLALASPDPFGGETGHSGARDVAAGDPNAGKKGDPNARGGGPREGESAEAYANRLFDENKKWSSAVHDPVDAFGNYTDLNLFRGLVAAGFPSYPPDLIAGWKKKQGRLYSEILREINENPRISGIFGKALDEPGYLPAYATGAVTAGIIDFVTGAFEGEGMKRGLMESAGYPPSLGLAGVGFVQDKLADLMREELENENIRDKSAQDRILTATGALPKPDVSRPAATMGTEPAAPARPSSTSAEPAPSSASRPYYGYGKVIVDSVFSPLGFAARSMSRNRYPA